MTLNEKELKELLHYNPDTGVFTWKVRRQGVNPDNIAGSVKRSRYVRIRINGKTYSAHRLAFLYMTGALPIGSVDHINGNRFDNRFSNLREASPSQNQFNSKRSSRNTSGIKGISYVKKSNTWRARITCGGVVYNLGDFKSKEQAEAVIKSEREKLHGEFVNFG